MTGNAPIISSCTGQDVCVCVGLIKMLTKGKKNYSSDGMPKAEIGKISHLKLKVDKLKMNMTPHLHPHHLSASYAS